MADYTPVFSPGTTRTYTTSAAVVGGTIAELSGNGTVATAGADSTKVVGVFAHDAASGAKVTVHAMDGVTHEIAATAGVTAGDGLATGASGTVKTVVVATAAAAGTLIGIAETTASAGNKTRFIGRR